MSATVRCLLVDPERKHVTPILLRGKNLVTPVRRAIRSPEIGWQMLVEIEERRRITQVRGDDGRMCTADGGPTPLMVAAAANAKKGENPGFRLRLGGDSTAGRALIFGQGVGGGMCDCPVDAEWLHRQIRWLDAAETAEDTEGSDDDGAE